MKIIYEKTIIEELDDFILIGNSYDIEITDTTTAIHSKNGKILKLHKGSLVKQAKFIQSRNGYQINVNGDNYTIKRDSNKLQRILPSTDNRISFKRLLEERTSENDTEYIISILIEAIDHEMNYFKHTDYSKDLEYMLDETMKYYAYIRK